MVRFEYLHDGLHRQLSMTREPNRTERMGKRMKNAKRFAGLFSKWLWAAVLTLCILASVALAGDAPAGWATAFAPDAAEITGEAKVLQAAVIAAPQSETGDELQVDKGAADGVEPGMTVITADGLAGYVTEVKEETALICGLANSALRTDISVTVFPSRETGTLVVGGQDGDGLTLVYLHESTEVAGGDEVFTNGLPVDSYPRGVRVGYVADRLESRENGSAFQVRSAVDFSKLESVLILLNLPNAHVEP